MTLYGLYTPEELLSRPIEHVLEAIPAYKLAEAWHMNCDDAARIKREPWVTLSDSPRHPDSDPLTPERLRQLKDWLEGQV